VRTELMDTRMLVLLIQVSDLRCANMQPQFTFLLLIFAEINVSIILRFCVELQLTSLLSETGLDILEAHAFSTIDGYSLDVFVVGGWPIEVSPYYFTD